MFDRLSETFQGGKSEITLRQLFTHFSGLQPDVPLTTPWTGYDTGINLGVSEVLTFTASASDPFINAVTPVSGTDYTLLSGAVTPTLSRTSGASTTITLTAGGGGAVLAERTDEGPCHLRVPPAQDDERDRAQDV